MLQSPLSVTYPPVVVYTPYFVTSTETTRKALRSMPAADLSSLSQSLPEITLLFLLVEVKRTYYLNQALSKVTVLVFTHTDSQKIDCIWIILWLGIPRNKQLSSLLQIAGVRNSETAECTFRSYQSRACPLLPQAHTAAGKQCVCYQHRIWYIAGTRNRS